MEEQGYYLALDADTIQQELLDAEIMQQTLTDNNLYGGTIRNDDVATSWTSARHRSSLQSPSSNNYSEMTESLGMRSGNESRNTRHTSNSTASTLSRRNR
jgi:hypothetical protein